MSHGVEFLANYTLSRRRTAARPTTPSASLEPSSKDSSILNPFDRTITEGPSALTSDIRFTASVVWQPGFGKNARAVVKQIVGGWNVATTFTATNGTTLLRPCVQYGNSMPDEGPGRMERAEFMRRNAGFGWRHDSRNADEHQRPPRPVLFIFFRAPVLHCRTIRTWISVLLNSSYSASAQLGTSRRRV
jgi:hypothetical protein